jgi:hypothetical protein
MTAVVASTYRGSMAYRQIKAFSIIDKHGSSTVWHCCVTISEPSALALSQFSPVTFADSEIVWCKMFFASSTKLPVDLSVICRFYSFSFLAVWSTNLEDRSSVTVSAGMGLGSGIAGMAKASEDCSLPSPVSLD